MKWTGRLFVLFLRSPVGWLNDNILFAAQVLLKKTMFQIPGLQPTTLGLTRVFEIQIEEFESILHDCLGYWLIVTTIGTKERNEIIEYDSLCPPPVGTYIQREIAALMFCKANKICAMIMDIQLQYGVCDYGLFAIAFSTAQENGFYLAILTFDQKTMRKHLCHCLSEKHLTMFPVAIKRNRIVVKLKHIIPVFCTCRMSIVPPMVECSSCLEWYLVSCVNVSKQVLTMVLTVICIRCVSLPLYMLNILFIHVCNSCYSYNC